MTVIGQTAARRILGVLAVALAAAGIAPAASASQGLPAPRSPKATSTPTPPAATAAALNGMRFGVRLADIPVDDEKDPRAWKYIVDTLPTGAVIHRRVLIINQEHTTADFSVYPGAAQISNGTFIGLAASVGNELTGWITVQHPTVRLGPGKATLDQVTIRVPKGATRGEHYGVIWTQTSAPVKKSGRVALNVSGRIGIRIYLGVGRGGLPPTKFEIMSMTTERRTPDRPLLIVHVNNVGGRAVDLNSKLQLTQGPGGASDGPFGALRVVTFAPGQSGDVIFALPATLPAGPWLASVTMQSGLDVATAQKTVLFAGPQAMSWINTATMAGGGALLVLLAIATFVGVRMRRARRAFA